MSNLTPTMAATLQAIKNKPGILVRKTPGGMNSVRALMKRALVEIDGEEECRVWPPAHRHQWKMGLHADGCHFFMSNYGCECGAHMTASDERVPRRDDYSLVWLTPDTCERCRELLRGAPGKSYITIYRGRQPVAV